MNIVRRAALAASAALLLGAAAPASKKAAPAGSVVTLDHHPGSASDRLAHQVAAEDLAAARTRGDSPLVLTGRAALGGTQPALLVQLQSENECGSAGCTTSVYSFERGKWTRVLDSATGKLLVAAKKTRGRNDIVSADDHFVWNGSSYVSLNPAPAIDLKPRPHRR